MATLASHCFPAAFPHCVLLDTISFGASIRVGSTENGTTLNANRNNDISSEPAPAIDSLQEHNGVVAAKPANRKRRKDPVENDGSTSQVETRVSKRLRQEAPSTTDEVNRSSKRLAAAKKAEAKTTEVKTRGGKKK